MPSRVYPLLQEHAPQLVLVGIGGNDFLRRVNDAATRANIRRICEQGAGEWCAGDADCGAGAERGRRDCRIVDRSSALRGNCGLAAPATAREGWSTVLANAALRSDQIHANARGYEVLPAVLPMPQGQRSVVTFRLHAWPCHWC